jgi:hypothetical protein
MNTFDKFATIRNILANRCGEIMMFKNQWNDYYSASRIKDFPTDLKEEVGNLLFDLDPSALTKEEMMSLGFIDRSKEFPFYKIPLWAYPFLEDGIEVEYSDGTPAYIDKSDPGDGCVELCVRPR